MNQPHIQQPPEDWRVYFDGNFWGKGRRGARPGKALTVNARFVWGSEQWYVPAVYPCGKGLVVDCCVAVDPARERAFLEKWQPATLDETRLTRAQRDQLDQENPLNVAFRPCVTVNGKQLPPKSSCAISWLPATLLPAGVQNAREAQAILTHYELDEGKAWAFCRCVFPWATVKKPTIKTLRLKLARRPVQLAGPRFCTPAVGEQLNFAHPLSGTHHTLTVLHTEQQTLSPAAFARDGYDFPTHHTVMTFTLEPELPAERFLLRDCLDNDAPRPKPRAASTPRAASAAYAIGIIGGADGPTAIYLRNQRSGPAAHTAVSALHFAPQSDVSWRLIFREKLLPDIDIPLLL